MPPRLEEWSVADHARFLIRGAPWLLAAALVAGGVAWATARGQTVTRADALLQLGHNPVTGWLEPPNELIARMSSPTFLADVEDGRPAGGVPSLSVSQIPSSGYVRIRGAASDPEVMRWTIETAIARVIESHDERAALAGRARDRRAAQLDADIARLRDALELPMGDDPEQVVARQRLVLRLSQVERERDDLRPDVKIASPSTTRLVQPVVYSTRTRGSKQAIYGGFAGLLLGLTLLYLRAGLRSSARATSSAIERS